MKVLAAGRCAAGQADLQKYPADGIILPGVFFVAERREQLDMVLLTAKHIRKSFSEKQLLEDVDLSINSGEKIGLVGVNGSGKSTLLQIIAGTMDEDGGEIIRNNELRTGFLPQNPAYDPEKTVLQQALADVKGEAEEYRVKTLLTRVGMGDYDKPMKELSGGQRKRVALAAVLCSDTNQLILDEPTNHMDNAIIEWLEDQLAAYKGAVFMITHDRYFLERVTDHICEIEKGRLVSYEGNYESYLIAKEERLEQAKANERKRANLYRKELRWIRWTAPARTTKSRSRVQRFEQIKDAKETFDDPRLEIGTISSRLGKKVIELSHISKSFEGVKYINDFSYTILRNDRMGIVGNNGCGKTTLLKIIMGQVEPDEGTIDIGETVKIGYFSQESEEMDPNKRVIKYIEDIARNVRTKDGELSASQMLERFLFPPYMHSVKIGKLSGGEKRRLYLLSVLMQAPNVLILDEPTNDLDIDTLTVLEDYLDDFPGAVVIVSHDRYFLDRLVVKTFAFEEDGHIREYTGGYSKYMNEKEAREAAQQSASGDSSSSDSSPSTKSTGAPAAAPAENSRRHERQKLKFSYREKQEYETIDDDIAALEEKSAELEQAMEQHATEPLKLSDLAKEKAAVDKQLEEKMERWEYLNELAERIENGELVEK